MGIDATELQREVQVNLRRLMCLTALLHASGALRAQPTPGSPLAPDEYYRWSIRASHADVLLIAVGDSLDVVLLRDRCGADAGYGKKGCWDESTVHVSPQWKISTASARVRALPMGSWIFGPGTAGARLYAMHPGAAQITALLPSGESVFDSLRVIAAPGAIRILLEPKPVSIVAEDTVRLRITARDSANRIVAIIPAPRDWNVQGLPDSAGFTAVSFPLETRGVLVARLGRLTDSLILHAVPRTKA